MDFKIALINIFRRNRRQYINFATEQGIILKKNQIKVFEMLDIKNTVIEMNYRMFYTGEQSIS